MNTIKQIITNENFASSSRCLEYLGVTITDADGHPLEGDIKLKDGTLCRFQKGLLDGNIYDKEGKITLRRPAMEYEFGGAEFCEKGLLDGCPAVIQNFGFIEEDWIKGKIQVIRSEVQLESLE